MSNQYTSSFSLSVDPGVVFHTRMFERFYDARGEFDNFT